MKTALNCMVNYLKKPLLAFALIALCRFSSAQELNCQVSIIFQPGLQVGPVEKEIVTELELAIYDFMNNTRWTNDVFEIEERINCNILITLSAMPSTTTFSGKIQVQSSRPVYNTSYNSVLLNYEDPDLSFSYLRNSALLF